MSEMQIERDGGQQRATSRVTLRRVAMKKAAIINPELLFINGHGFVNIDELAPAERPLVR